MVCTKRNRCTPCPGKAHESRPHVASTCAAFKRALIERSLHPGASVSAIALENCVNANLLFKWRRAHLRAKVGASAPGARELAGRSAHTRLLPVRIEPALMGIGAMTPSASMPRPSLGVI